MASRAHKRLKTYAENRLQKKTYAVQYLKILKKLNLRRKDGPVCNAVFCVFVLCCFVSVFCIVVVFVNVVAVDKLKYRSQYNNNNNATNNNNINNNNNNV